MSSESKVVQVLLLGRTFSFRCPIEREAGLLVAVERFNQRLQQLRAGMKTQDFEQVLAVGAIHLAYDLESAEQAVVAYREEANRHCEDWVERLDEVLQGCLLFPQAKTT